MAHFDKDGWHPFNLQHAKDRADATEIRRQITRAKKGHPDMLISHPDWVRDANAANPNFVVLIKKTKERLQKYHAEVDRRNAKIE